MFTALFMESDSAQEAKFYDRVEDLFKRYGIKSLTMDAVASDLGISKKTLYQWVSSKDDLVVKVLSHHIQKEKAVCIDRMTEASNALEEVLILLETNSQRLTQMKTNMVYDLQKFHPDGWELVHKFNFDFVLKIIRENIERGRREGLYRDDFDIEVISRMHLAMARSIYDLTIFPEEMMSRVQLFREYILHYLRGIVSENGMKYLQQKLKPSI